MGAPLSMGPAMMVVALLCVTSFPMLTCCSGDGSVHIEAQKDWPSFRGDIWNTGSRANSYEMGHLGVLWEFRADSAITSTISTGSGLAAFGTMNGSVYACDVDDGTLRWKVNVGAEVDATPLFLPDGGGIVVCDLSGKVRRLSLEGTTDWTYDTGSGMAIHSSPQYYEGSILFGSYDSSFYCLNAGNGTLRWRYTGCASWIHTSPSVSARYYDAQYTYFGSCDGSMNCVDVKDGSLIWTFKAEYIPSSPALDMDSVFFGSYDRKLYCLDAMTGDMRWNRSFAGPIFSSPAVLDDRVVVGCDDGTLNMMDAQNGSLIWSVKVNDGKLDPSPVLTANWVICTFQNGLVVLSAGNGSMERSFELGDAGGASPSLHDGTVLFGDAQGYARALGAEGPVDEDDDTVDFGREDDPARDAIFLAIGFVAIFAVSALYFWRRYKALRKGKGG